MSNTRAGDRARRDLILPRLSGDARRRVVVVKVQDVVAGRYELREALGGGGLGQVFRALDERALQEVAVKVLDPARCPEDALRRHAALVTGAARAKHPAIALARVELASPGQPPLTVGELIAGEDLDGLRARVGALPWRRAAEIVESCAEALAALASATGAAHRALKPGNVRLGAGGEPRLLDFGIAELGVQPVAPRGGVYVEYRAPEQLEGAPGDASADVFALGVLLFEMVTGVHPFAGPSTFKVMHRVLLQAPPRPSELAPELGLPATLEALLARALARRPADRFADPAELGKMLALVRRASGALLAPAPAHPKASPIEDGTEVIPTAAAEDEPSTVLRRVSTGDSVVTPPPEEPTSPPPAAPQQASTSVAPPRVSASSEPAPLRVPFVAPPLSPLRVPVAPRSSAPPDGPPLLATASMVAPIEPSTLVVVLPGAGAERGELRARGVAAAPVAERTEVLVVPALVDDVTEVLRVAGADGGDGRALAAAEDDATYLLTAAEIAATSRPPAPAGPVVPTPRPAPVRTATPTRGLLVVNVVLVALTAAGLAYLWLG